MDVSRLRRAVERRVAAPALWRVLASPGHWPLSEWLSVVSVERDGDRVLVPVSFDRDGDELYVVVPRTAGWWRAFEGGETCRVAVRGARRRATGELVTDAIEHQQRVSAFLHPAGAFAGAYGDGSLESADFSRYVLVRLSLD